MPIGSKIATWAGLGLLALFVARSTATHDAARSELDLAQAMARTQVRAIERAMPSVVSIRAIGTAKDEFGAGVFVSAEGHLLTALHVVAKAKKLEVRTADGARFSATVHARDPRIDLAVLLVDGKGRRFRPCEFLDDRAVPIGSPILAIGNPFGLYTSVSRGVLSARDRTDVVQDNAAPLLQTDAAINPGSSGGVLVSLTGSVIGVVTAILTRTGGHQGIGFAVPTSELQHALPSLLAGEASKRAWIGIRVRPGGHAERGLEVLSTVPAGPAATAGLRSGDVVLRINGRRLSQVAELRQALRHAQVGQVLELGIRRAAALLDVKVVTASSR